MSDLGYNGPDAPQKREEHLAEEVTTEESMESTENATLPDQGSTDGSHEGAVDHGYEQGQGGT